MKTTWIDPGWYPVRIGFVPNKKAWAKTMKELKCDMGYPMREVAGACCTHIEDDKGNCVLLVAVNKTSDALYAILAMAHESVHVWQFIKKHIGEETPGLEQEAYAVENILRQLTAAYSEANPKDHKRKKKC